MVELGPAHWTPEDGIGKGVWHGLPFAENDTVSRYVTSEFGAWEKFRRDLGWGPHTGIDIHAAIGTPLHALGPGLVMMARESGIFPVAGKYVQIDHGEGVQSFYLHMDTIAVEIGDTVERGQYIGTSGNSSSLPIAAHLHLGIKIDWKNVDPVRNVVKEITVPGELKLKPVEAIMMVVDGTVPVWDKELTVVYDAERDEDGNEVHTYRISKEDRERIELLAETVEF